MSAEESLAALIRRWAESQLLAPAEEQDLYDRFLKIVEPPLFETALEHYHGQFLAAARRLGIHRTTLKKKIGDAAKDP